MDIFPRKYLIEGDSKTGKSALIQAIYNKVTSKIPVTNLKTTGFKTGDLRYFNLE